MLKPSMDTVSSKESQVLFEVCRCFFTSVSSSTVEPRQGDGDQWSVPTLRGECERI